MAQQVKPHRTERFNRVRVKIAGDVYDVKSEASVPYIQSVAELVDRKMTEMVKAFPSVSRHRLAVMVAMNFADELLRIKGDSAGELAATSLDDMDEGGGRHSRDGGNLIR